MVLAPLVLVTAESEIRLSATTSAVLVLGGLAQLGSAFAKILGDLQQERSELERRVAVRTREVERLAEESRYAAIVRERLNIARDLHDTLAHSMMAILSEIRFLRRLQSRDPAAVGLVSQCLCNSCQCGVAFRGQ